jgi:hypothetical protein
MKNKSDRVIRVLTPQEFAASQGGRVFEIFAECVEVADRLPAERRPEPQRQNPRQVDQEPGQTSGPGAGG